MVYLFLKTVHILATIIFVGNITLNYLWKSAADRSGDTKIIAHTFKNIRRGDIFFTMPSFLILFIFGLGAAMHYKYDLIETGWIFWSIVIFVLSAGIFMGIVVPTQKKIIALASNNSFTIQAYSELAKKWSAWVIISIVLLIIAIVFMVYKLPQ